MEGLMSNLIGTYGIIANNESVISCSDPSFANYDDLGWWRTHLLCVKENTTAVTLQSPNGVYKIEIYRQGYNLLGTPCHHVGDKVQVKRSGRLATVKDVQWHFNREAFYYTLDYGNRVSTNWFFDEDLEAC